MEEFLMSKEKNWMEEYIEQEVERIKNQPRYIAYRENQYVYVVVEDSPENIEKFEAKFTRLFREDVFVYYNDSEMYDKICDVLTTHMEWKKEKEKQVRLENPQVWEEVKNIQDKDELIEYLMWQWHVTNITNVEEYSGNVEIDKAEMKVTEDELRKKVEEFL